MEQAVIALDRLPIASRGSCRVALPSLCALGQSAQPTQTVSSLALRQAPNVGETKAAATVNYDSRAVVGLVGGRAVAVWTDFGGVEAEVRAQMINSDGTLFGPEIVISEQPGPLPTAGAQTSPDVAALSDGGWVVTWQDNDPVGNDVLAQIYNADGSFRSVPGGSDPGRIVIGGADNDFGPTVAPISGGFVIIYGELVGATDQVLFQRYNLA